MWKMKQPLIIKLFNNQQKENKIKKKLILLKNNFLFFKYKKITKIITGIKIILEVIHSIEKNINR